MAHPVAVAALLLACAAAMVSAVTWLRTPPGSPVTGGLALVSTAGLLASVGYLSTVADEPAAIPVAGTLALLLSLVGLAVAAVVLHDRGVAPLGPAPGQS